MTCPNCIKTQVVLLITKAVHLPRSSKGCPRYLDLLAMVSLANTPSYPRSFKITPCNAMTGLSPGSFLVILAVIRAGPDVPELK